jgi:hypothetical protein
MVDAFACVKMRIQAAELDEDQKRRAMRNLVQSFPDEIFVLFGMFELPATWRFTGEILKGAHVRIFDLGERYNDWKTLPSARTRRSSHKSDGPQYHVDGPLVSTVLFGKIGSWTWLQLEGHPQGIGHVVDWVKYSVTHRNQGPYGSSHHVENRPIEIHPTRRHIVLPRATGWVDKLQRTPRARSPFGT